MRVSEAFSNAVAVLSGNGIDNPPFEVDCLIHKAFGIGKTERLTHPDTEVDYSLLLPFLKKRASGFPLQYIIGEWSFYGYDYYVGEGVLIPRPETENLVGCVIGHSERYTDPVIYDLCAGSGCIGLTLAREVKNSSVYLFEKSDDALKYLNKNAQGVSNASVIKADIFNFDFSELPKPDIIVSNPPYIESGELPLLQREVLFEPSMALDGGEDGLDFYRLFASRLLPMLKNGGFSAVECGENQADSIIKLFGTCLKKTYAEEDFNGVKRFVIGEK